MANGIRDLTEASGKKVKMDLVCFTLESCDGSGVSYTFIKYLEANSVKKI